MFVGQVLDILFDHSIMLGDGYCDGDVVVGSPPQKIHDTFATSGGVGVGSIAVVKSVERGD